MSKVTRLLTDFHTMSGTEMKVLIASMTSDEKAEFVTRALDSHPALTEAALVIAAALATRPAEERVIIKQQLDAMLEDN
jgi:hypothetical protein